MNKEPVNKVGSSRSTEATPGPWRIEYDRPMPWRQEATPSRVLGADGEDICLCGVTITGWANTEAAANTRLIAAAPDMRNLLSDVLDYLQGEEDVKDYGEGKVGPNRAMSLASEIREVLQKVKA